MLCNFSQVLSTKGLPRLPNGRGLPKKHRSGLAFAARLLRCNAKIIHFRAKSKWPFAALTFDLPLHHDVKKVSRAARHAKEKEGDGMGSRKLFCIFAAFCAYMHLHPPHSQEARLASPPLFAARHPCILRPHCVTDTSGARKKDGNIAYFGLRLSIIQVNLPSALALHCNYILRAAAQQ